MSTLLHFNGLEAATLPAQPLHLAIGMFDGVHRGHQSVIAAAVHAAQHGGGLAGVLSFWPHPSALFRPENPTLLLMPPAMKRRVLHRLGIDFLIEQNFSREFAGIEARDFVPQLRRCLPQLGTVYVGENWRFGRGRSGDVAFLQAEAAKVGLAVVSAPRLNLAGAPISSSRIRELLAAGAMAEVNRLLGYTYFSEGVVTPGRQLGRTLGFPTLNLDWRPELKPRFGVYAVAVDARGQSGLPGVASYGLRPTVESAGQPLLEVFLLDPTTLTYGDQLTVKWLEFLRPESKFNSLEELRLQIDADVRNGRKYFAENRPATDPKDA